MASEFPGTNEFDLFDIFGGQAELDERDQELIEAERELETARLLGNVAVDQTPFDDSAQVQEAARGDQIAFAQPPTNPDDDPFSPSSPDAYGGIRDYPDDFGAPEPNEPAGPYRNDASFEEFLNPKGRLQKPARITFQEARRQNAIKNVARMQILLGVMNTSKKTGQYGELSDGFWELPEDEQVKAYNDHAKKFGPNFDIKKMSDLPWINRDKGKEPKALDPRTFGDSMSEWWSLKGLEETIPFWRDIGYAGPKFYQLWKSSEKIENETDSPEDWMRLQAFTQELIEDARGKDWSGWTGDIMKDMVPLILEFAVSRGAGRRVSEWGAKKFLMEAGEELTEESIKKLIKEGGAKGFAAKVLGAHMLGAGVRTPTLLRKALRRMVGRTAYKSGEKVAKKRLKREIAQDFGAWFTKNALETFVGTSTVLQGRNLANMFKNMVPGIQVSTDEAARLERVVNRPDPGWVDAYKEAYVDSYIEIFSESTGEVVARFAPSLTAGAKKAGVAMLRRMPEKYSNFLKMHVIAKTSRAMKLSVGDTLDWIAEHGYHGPVGEMFEERFADFVRAVSTEVGLIDTGSWSDIIPSGPQLAGEASAFAIFGGTAQGMQRAPHFVKSMIDIAHGGSEAQHEAARELLAEQLESGLIDQAEHDRVRAKYDKPAVEQRVQEFIDSDGSREAWNALPQDVRTELAMWLKHYNPELETEGNTDPSKNKTSKPQRVYMADLVKQAMRMDHLMTLQGVNRLRAEELDVYAKAVALRNEGKEEEAQAVMDAAGLTFQEIAERSGLTDMEVGKETFRAIERQGQYWRENGLRLRELLEFGERLGLEPSFAVRDEQGIYDEQKTIDKLVLRMRTLSRNGQMSWQLQHFAPTLSEDYARILNAKTQDGRKFEEPLEEDAAGRTAEQRKQAEIDGFWDMMAGATESEIDEIYRDMFPEGKAITTSAKKQEMMEGHRTDVGDKFDTEKQELHLESQRRRDLAEGEIEHQERKTNEARLETTELAIQESEVGGEAGQHGRVFDAVNSLEWFNADQYKNHVNNPDSKYFGGGVEALKQYARDAAMKRIDDPRAKTLGGVDMFGEVQADPANPSTPAIYSFGDQRYAIKRPSILINDHRGRYHREGEPLNESELSTEPWEVDASRSFIVDEYVDRSGKQYSAEDAPHPTAIHPTTGELGVAVGRSLGRGVTFETVEAAKAYIDQQIQGRKESNDQTLAQLLVTEEGLQNRTSESIKEIWRRLNPDKKPPGKAAMIKDIMDWQFDREVEQEVHSGFVHQSRGDRRDNITSSAQEATRRVGNSEVTQEQAAEGFGPYHGKRVLRKVYSDGTSTTVGFPTRTRDANPQAYRSQDVIAEMLMEDAKTGKLTSARVEGEIVVAQNQRQANEGKGKKTDTGRYSVRVWTKPGVAEGKDLTKQEKAERKRERELGHQRVQAENQEWERRHYNGDRPTVDTMTNGPAPRTPRVPEAVTAEGDELYNSDHHDPDGGVTQSRAEGERAPWLVHISPSQPERIEKFKTNRAGKRNAKHEALKAGISLEDFEQLWKSRRGRKILARRVSDFREIKHQIYERLASGPATVAGVVDFLNTEADTNLSLKNEEQVEAHVETALQLLTDKGWLGKRQIPHPLYGSVDAFVLPEAELYNTLHNGFPTMSVEALDVAVQEVMARRSFESGFQNKYDWLVASRSLDPRVYYADGGSIFLIHTHQTGEIARSTGIPERVILSYFHDVADMTQFNQQNPSLEQWANTTVRQQFKWILGQVKSGRTQVLWSEIHRVYGTNFDWGEQNHRPVNTGSRLWQVQANSLKKKAAQSLGVKYKDVTDEQVAYYLATAPSEMSYTFDQPYKMDEVAHLPTVMRNWILHQITSGKLGPQLQETAVQATNIAATSVLNSHTMPSVGHQPEIIAEAARRARTHYSRAHSNMPMEVVAAAMWRAHLSDSFGQAADRAIESSYPVGEGEGGVAAMSASDSPGRGGRRVDDDPALTETTGEAGPAEGQSELMSMPLSEEAYTEAGEQMEDPSIIINWASGQFGVHVSFRGFDRQRRAGTAGMYFRLSGQDIGSLEELQEYDYSSEEVIQLLNGYERSLPVFAHELGHHVDQRARVELVTRFNEDPSGFSFQPSKQQFLGGLLNVVGGDAYGEVEIRTIEQELKQLDYRITLSVLKRKPLDWEEHGRATEGFAEYIRIWLTRGEEKARQAAPHFHEFFHSQYANHFTEYYDSFKRLKAKVKTYQEAGSEQRVAATLVGPNEAGSNRNISTGWNKFRQYIDDDLNVLRQFENQLMRTEGAPYIPEGDRPYMLARVLKHREGALAWDAVINGVRRIDHKADGYGQSIGKGLVDALSPLAKLNTEQFEAFVRYMYARHAVDVWEEGLHPGAELQDLENVLKRHKAEADPEFVTQMQAIGFSVVNPETGEVTNKYSEAWEQAATQITQWNKDHLTMLHHAGMMDKQTLDLITAKYPHYIPLQRVANNLRAKGIKTGFVDVMNPVGRMRGSAFQVLDPLTAMISQSVKFHSAAAKSIVANALVDMAEQVEGFGSVIREIPPPENFTTLNPDEVQKILRSFGFDTNDLTKEQRSKAITVLTGMGGHHHTRDNVVRIVRGRGEESQIKWYELNPDLMESIDNLNDRYTSHGIVADTISGISRGMTRSTRAGATALNIAFNTFFNPGRDVQEHVFKTEGFTPPRLIHRASRLPLESDREGQEDFSQWLVQEGLITNDERDQIGLRKLEQHDKDGNLVTTHTEEEDIKKELVRRILARQMLNPINPLSMLQMAGKSIGYTLSYGQRIVSDWWNGFDKKSDEVINRNSALQAVFDRFGGVMSTYIGQDLNDAHRKAEDLERKIFKSDQSVFQNGVHYIMRPGQFLSRILAGAQRSLSISEVGPRLSEMNNILKKSGYTLEDLIEDKVPMHVQMEMMYMANTSTIDFSRAGKWTRVLNQHSAFSNVQIQSPIQAYQKMFTRKGKFDAGRLGRRTVRGFVQYTIPTIINWAMNKDEEWYRSLTPRDRIFFWHVKMAEDAVVGIPRLHDVGFVFSGLIEAMLDSWYTGEDRQMKELAKVVGENYNLHPTDLAMEHLPDVLTLAVELMIPEGYSSFLNRKLIPRELMEKDFELRYDETTTNMAIKAGEMLNFAPKKFDHAMNRITGGMYGKVFHVNAHGKLNRITGYNRLNRTGGYGAEIQEFYEQKEQIKHKMSHYEKGEAPPLLQSDHDWNERSHSVMSTIQKLVNSRKKDPDNVLKYYQSVKTGMARRSLGLDFFESFPDPFRASPDSLPDDVREIRDDVLGDRLMDVSEELDIANYRLKGRARGLSWERIEAGVLAEQLRIDRAKKWLHPSMTTIDYPEAHRILLAEMKKRGVRMRPGVTKTGRPRKGTTEAVDRLGRLRQYFQTR